MDKVLLLFLAIALASMWFVEGVPATPQIEFVNPTPSDETNTSNTSIVINISIIESSLREVKFNWNRTNYTSYDDSVTLIFNLDNISALGENDTYVVDVSKNSNNGTVTGATWNLTGKYGGAFEFDGDADYVEVAYNESLDNPDAFTLSAWVKSNIDGTDYTESGFIIDMGFVSNRGYGLSYSSHSWIESFSGYYNSITTYDPSFSLVKDTWYHLAFTFNGSKQILYVDGVSRASDDNTIGLIDDNPLRIGAMSKSVDLCWNGIIDELRIFNRSLSQSEVQQLYFTNLYKYDTDKWVLYANQKKNSTTGLDNGDYTYQAFASDSAGNLNQTEERTVTIAAAVINAYNLNYTSYWVKKNNTLLLNITDCTGEFTFNWTIDGALASNSREFNLNSSNYSVGVHNVTGYCYDNSGGSDSQSFNIEIIGERDFTIIALPDTQKYAQLYPGIFDNQTSWISEISTYLNVSFVLHLGDVVEHGHNSTQYTYANNSMTFLDNGNVPYGTAIGNHDYNWELAIDRDATNWNTYFNSSRYESYSWWGGSKDNNGDNTYFFFNESNNMEFLVIFLEFCPRNATITWANDIINNNSGKRVIIVSHLYLNDDNTRMDEGDQNHCADSAGSAGDYNDGEDIWNKLGNPNNNVFFINSGHISSDDGIGYRNDTGTGGNIVHQILSNYQDYSNGGNGYLRIYRFSPDEDTIYAKTYSPYLDAFDISSNQNFTMGYNMAPTAPSISFSCSPASVNTGQTITCSCSATDDVDSSPTVSYTVNPSTSNTGTFTTTCTAEDSEGNSATSSISYTVSSVGGGGGYRTFNPTQEQLKNDYEKSLRKNWKIEFEFNNETHTIKLDKITNETAVITILSEPLTFDLTLNETKRLNLDNDSYCDLQIFLKDISDYEVDLVVKLIHEEILIEVCEPNWSCGSWSECVNYTQTRICTDLNNCNTTEDKPDEVRDCCEPDWQCTKWSECINEQQTRICRDLSNCSVAEGKPPDVKSCDVKGKWRPMAIANESIFLAKEKIQEALGKGLDVNQAQSLLEQALSYFEAGNYPKADELAKQAYDMAEQLLSQYKPPDWKTKEIEWAYYVPVLIVLVIVVVYIVLTWWKKNVISSFRKRLRSSEHFKIVLAWNSIAWEAIASVKVGWDLVYCGR